MANYKVIYFDKIPSTQTHAHNMIADGTATDRVAIVAAAQTAGRGRYKNRKWVSHQGNLYVSFIYRCVRRDARVSYAVAVAVAETLRAFGAPANIKWPNDVLVNGGKISGILIEYNESFMVVGIGINVASAPAVADYPTARLADWARDATTIGVLNQLMHNLDMWMTADFTAVRKRWMELTSHMNGIIKYHGDDAKFIGINSDGAMILEYNGANLLVYGDEITC